MNEMDTNKLGEAIDLLEQVLNSVVDDEPIKRSLKEHIDDLNSIYNDYSETEESNILD